MTITGISPIANVDPPINNKVIMNVYFLPITSPQRPNTIAPKGLITKPTPKAANVARKAAVGFSFGKNCVDNIGQTPENIKVIPTRSWYPQKRLL